MIKPFDFERFKESLLQYKKKAELMKDEQAVSQEELDAFLLRKKDLIITPWNCLKAYRSYFCYHC